MMPSTTTGVTSSRDVFGMLNTHFGASRETFPLSIWESFEYLLPRMSVVRGPVALRGHLAVTPALGSK
jgi:hypothetical protein